MLHFFSVGTSQLFYCITFLLQWQGNILFTFKLYPHIPVAVMALTMTVDLVCCADNARDFGKKKKQQYRADTCYVVL